MFVELWITSKLTFDQLRFMHLRLVKLIEWLSHEITLKILEKMLEKHKIKYPNNCGHSNATFSFQNPFELSIINYYFQV